jgi:hypothetical protein
VEDSEIREFWRELARPVTLLGTARRALVNIGLLALTGGYMVMAFAGGGGNTHASISNDKAPRVY